MNTANLSIAAVERNTGLSKDVLRVWERRYGFPAPSRDANGERSYPADQVERLRQIKRLMDQGYRPGKLIALPAAELSRLAPRVARDATVAVIDPASSANTDGLSEWLALIKQHDADAFTQAMQQRLARLGLQTFVQDIVAPLTTRVGQAWQEGFFEVFEEHLFTELTERVLRQAIATLPRNGGSPRVLLTSLPDEQHILGLLMIEALLTLEGAACIPLGVNMPLPEIIQAAQAHRADIVALSFSAAFPTRQIPELVQQLRRTLPAPIDLWIGGAGVIRLTPPPGTQRFVSLREGVEALSTWRANHALR